MGHYQAIVLWLGIPFEFKNFLTTRIKIYGYLNPLIFLIIKGVPSNIRLEWIKNLLSMKKGNQKKHKFPIGEQPVILWKQINTWFCHPNIVFSISFDLFEIKMSRAFGNNIARVHQTWKWFLGFLGSWCSVTIVFANMQDSNDSETATYTRICILWAWFPLLITNMFSQMFFQKEIMHTGHQKHKEILSMLHKLHYFPKFWHDSGTSVKKVLSHIFCFWEEGYQDPSPSQG